MPRLVEGETVARYRVAVFIAAGGMGEVYRATDVESGRPVALKLLAAPGDGRLAARFERERAIAAALDHPRIVPVYETGQDGAGRAYIAMRFVEGRDLASVLRDGPLPLERALAIVEQVALALDAAHDRGLVHRDVKPGNILLERLDGRDEAFLSDFGLVKELVVDDAVSGTGAVLGTSDYMPPEVLHGAVPDARSDVYALGCVLFEMLTGTPPFRRESEVATLWAHVNDDPPSLLDASPELPSALDGVIARALAKEPEERYGSAGDLAAAARAAAGGAAVEAPRRPRGAADVCPYKGLASFSEADADFFFGREELVEQLVPRLRASGFLAVVGASGSGKSSLVRAGLLAALGEPSSVITPGERPFHALAGDAPGAVLVVDQFEELFTLCPEESERRAFVSRLLHHTSPVVLVVRADFYDRCLAYPELASMLEHCQAAVGPMSDEALRRAITKPAQRFGLHLEHRLLETVVHDVAGQPGALPLLSHALLETWNRRVGRTLTLAGYLEAGGVEGALARTAQALYDEHDPGDRQLLRGMFLRLTALGEGTEDTRRRVAFGELVPSAGEEERVRLLVQRLVDARLVTVDGTSVEVGHEALIRHWPTLRAWLLEDRDGRRVHRRITESAQEWAALDRDPGALLRGGRLAPAAEWADQHDDELNDQERQFVAASRAAEEQQLADVRRRNRRLRLLVVALALLAVAAVSAAAIAVRQTGEARDQQGAADRQAAAAQEQSRIALSRGLAGQARALLTQRLDQALLLALEADRVAQTDESRDALLAAVQRTSGIETIVSGDQVSARKIAVSENGRTLAVVDSSGRLVIWDEAGRRLADPIALPQDPRQGEPSLAVAQDGTHVAAATGGDVAWLVDVRRPENRIMLHSGTYLPEGGSGPLATLAFSRDGKYLVGIYASNPAAASPQALGVLRWEIAAAKGGRYDWVGGSAHGFGYSVEGASSSDVVLSADASTLAYVADPHIAITEAATGRRIRTLSTVVARANGGALLAVSADGTRLANVRLDGTTLLWNVPSGLVQATYPPPGTKPTAIAFSDDGQDLLLGTGDGEVRVFAAATGVPIGPPLAAGVAGIVDVAESVAGGRLVSLGRDGMVLVHTGRRAGAPERVLVQAPRSRILAVAPDGQSAAIARDDGALSVRTLNDGDARVTLRDSPGAHSAAAFAVDGSVAWLAGNDGHLWRWDVSAARDARRQEGTFVGSPLAVSQDGRYVAARQNSDTGNVVVYRAGAEPVGRFVAPLPRHPVAAAFRPDATRVAVAFNDGIVEILDPADPSAVMHELTGHRGAVSDVAYSPDGADVASVGSDGTLRFWSAADGTPDGEPLSAGSGALRGVAFVGDGRVVATLGETSLRLWDVARRVPLGEGVLFPLDDPADQLEAAPADPSALVAWHDLVVRIDDLLWTLDPRRLAARVCQIVGRSLTRSELAQFEPGVAYHEQCHGTQPVAR